MRTSVKATLDEPEPPATNEWEVTPPDILGAAVGASLHEEIEGIWSGTIDDEMTSVDGVGEDDDEPEVTFSCGCVDDGEREACGSCLAVCAVHCTKLHCESCGVDINQVENQCSWYGTDDDVDPNCQNCCGCYKCYGCGAHKGSDGGDEFDCTECWKCHDCGCSCEEAGSGDTPWAMRGVIITKAELKEAVAGKSYEKLWPIQNTKIDVVQALADFYLLEGIAARVFNAPHTVHDDTTCVLLAEEADAAQAKLVALLDPSFANYVDMAVGGELRHHSAVGFKVLTKGTRTEAWREWRALRDQLGPQALLDAAVLFREIHGGGIGGEKWAQAAELLHQRITGVFTPKLFVDRVFAAQHNGGSLLNKIYWKIRNAPGWGIVAIANGVGDAHAASPPQWGVLLAACSDDVSALFGQWWRHTNRLRRELRMAVEPVPTWMTGGTIAGTSMRYGDRLTINLTLHKRWGAVDEHMRWLFGNPKFAPHLQAKPDTVDLTGWTLWKETDDGIQYWKNADLYGSWPKLLTLGPHHRYSYGPEENKHVEAYLLEMAKHDAKQGGMEGWRAHQKQHYAAVAKPKPTPNDIITFDIVHNAQTLTPSYVATSTAVWAKPVSYDQWINMPIKEADPELDKLLAEEEKLEALVNAANTTKESL